MPYYPSPLPLHPSPLVQLSPSHHGVQLLEATAPNEMMALRAIEHLDFESTLPCEHPQHADHRPDGPARWVYTGGCPRCPCTIRHTLCQAGRDRFYAYGMVCAKCGCVGPVDAFLISWEALP